MTADPAQHPAEALQWPQYAHPDGTLVCSHCHRPWPCDARVEWLHKQPLSTIEVRRAADVPVPQVTRVEWGTTLRDGHEWPHPSEELARCFVRAMPVARLVRRHVTEWMDAE